MAAALPHIVHVLSTVDRHSGGATAQLVTLVRAQVELGMRVSVVSTYAAGFNESAALDMRDGGAELHLVGPCTQVAAWHPKISPVLRDAIVEADVVHIHGLWEEIQHRAAVIAREQDVAYLFSLHGTLEPWAMQQSRLKKQIYMAVRMRKNLTSASALHYSDPDERALTADWKLSTPAIIQPYAVDLEPFERPPVRGIFRRAYPKLGDSPFVLFMGRLHARKGLDLLIPAFAKAGADDVKLVIAGGASDGQIEANVRQLIARHNLGDRCVMTGALEGNLRSAAYFEARLLALPSTGHQFGTVAIEALACELPILVTEHVALAQKIAEHGAGEVVGGDVDALAKALNSWLADEDRCRRAGENGRAWVSETFDARSSALAWANHYQEIMTGEVGLNHPAVA